MFPIRSEIRFTAECFNSYNLLTIKAELPSHDVCVRFLSSLHLVCIMGRCTVLDISPVLLSPGDTGPHDDPHKSGRWKWDEVCDVLHHRNDPLVWPSFWKLDSRVWLDYWIVLRSCWIFNLVYCACIWVTEETRGLSVMVPGWRFCTRLFFPWVTCRHAVRPVHASGYES